MTSTTREPRAEPSSGRAAPDEYDSHWLCDALTSIVILIDGDGLVRRWNRTAERTLRVSRNETLGRPLAALELPLTTVHLREVVERGDWRRRQVRIDNLPYLDADGQPRTLALTFHPVRLEDGTCAGALILGRDVTGRNEDEAQRIEQRRLEALASLAGGLAHELNNPVQFIASNLEFVEQTLSRLEQVIQQAATAFENSAGHPGIDEELDAVDRSLRDLEPDELFGDLRDAVAAIRQGWRRIAEIVTSMKDFAGLERSENRVDLSRAVRSAATVLAPEWHGKVRLELDVADRLPPFPGDPREISQLFYHLLTNAFEAAERSGADPAIVRVSVHRNGDEILLAVEDTGDGLTEAESRRVFDPFYTTKEVGRGTGQGLAIVEGIVRRHCGTISVGRSDLGGARFVVRFRAVPDAGMEDSR